jgi:hypothetical protein
MGSPVGSVMYYFSVVDLYSIFGRLLNIFGHINCIGSGPGFDPLGHKTANGTVLLSNIKFDTDTGLFSPANSTGTVLF